MGSSANSYRDPRSLTPPQLLRDLNKHVVGQTYAKKVVSVAICNHIKRQFYIGPFELEKSNILIIGPSGCGKTLLAKTAAKLVNVPFVIGNATSLTESGYVGDDVEVLLSRLLKASDGDVAAAEHGIIFLDELDKLVTTNPLEGVSTKGVQADLLKLLEGTRVDVPTTSNKSGPTVSINTSNIMFICAGAFGGLEKTIEQRTRPLQDKEIFTPGENFKDANHSDLKRFGLIAELVGRLPIIAPMIGHTETDLKRILTVPHSNIIKQYQELLSMDQIRLSFDPGALSLIAAQAFKEGNGARSLRSIIEKVLLDVMFDPMVYDSNLEITYEFVADRLNLSVSPSKTKGNKIIRKAFRDEDKKS